MSAQHTPGPWDIDEVDNDGEYGDGGPDSRSGFKSYCVIDADGNVLFDSLNRDSSVSLIEEESDDEDGSFHAWDELARRDLTLAAAAPKLLVLLEHSLCMTGPINSESNLQWFEEVRAAIAKATGVAS